VGAVRRPDLVVGSGRVPRTLILISALSIVALGCGDDDDVPALIVDVRTDFRPGIEFARVRVEAGPADGSESPRSAEIAVDVSDADDWLGGRRVSELTGVPPGDIRAVATLLLADGAVVGRQQVRIGYAGVTRGVTLVITRDCFGVTCPPAGGAPAMSACLSGMCADESCSPDNLTVCPAPACTSDAECSAGLAACASGRCIGGRCFASPDDSICGGGLCDPERGCSGGDGGLPDAGDTGAPDARDTGVLDAGDASASCYEIASATGPGVAGATSFVSDLYFWRFELMERYCVNSLGVSISDHRAGNEIQIGLYDLIDDAEVPDRDGGAFGVFVDPGVIGGPTDVEETLDEPFCLDPGWWAIMAADADGMGSPSSGHIANPDPSAQQTFRASSTGSTSTAPGRRLFIRGCEPAL